MIVVSDTTPLISLLKVGRIDLLEKLFGQVVVPQAVYSELTADERFKHENEQIKQSRFMAAYDERELTANEARECIDVLQRTGRHISQRHYQMLIDMLTD